MKCCFKNAKSLLSTITARAGLQGGLAKSYLGSESFSFLMSCIAVFLAIHGSHLIPASEFWIPDLNPWLLLTELGAFISAGSVV